MRISTLTALLLAVSSIVLADVKFTSPAPGDVVQGGGALTVKWTESGDSPSISDLSTYQLFLCAGGNDDASIVQLEVITTQGMFANGNEAEGTVMAGLGASVPSNSYFLKIISVATTGGTVTNYSGRFSISGMTGVFPAAVLSGMETVSTLDGPTRVVVTAAATPVGTGGFGIPYSLQTGPIMYAPMQSHPGTAITKQGKPTPLYPTSPYTLATTFLPPNVNIQKTITEPVTWSFSQIENTVAPQSQPTGDMQRFLERWKD